MSYQSMVSNEEMKSKSFGGQNILAKQVLLYQHKKETLVIRGYHSNEHVLSEIEESLRVKIVPFHHISIKT